MITVFNHDVYGKIEYDESIWTGKRKIRINGKELDKIDKTNYSCNTENGVINVSVKGNQLIGVKLTIGNEDIQVVEKPVWYVLALSIITFLFVIVWGNVPSLVEIFPIVGGAIGGFISALCAILNIFLAGKVNKPIFKVLIGLGFFAAAVSICFSIAFGIIYGMSMI